MEWTFDTLHICKEINVIEQTNKKGSGQFHN